MSGSLWSRVTPNECENSHPNGELEEIVYMDQHECFSIEGKSHMACKLKK